MVGAGQWLRCAPPQTVQRAPGHVRAPRACARQRAARSRKYNGTRVPRTASDSARVTPECMYIKSAASTVRPCDIRARAFNIALYRPSAPSRWRLMRPLCSRLQVRTAGMGGRALLHITSGASRHHKSNARAILRAPRPATRVTRILPASTPLSENPTDTPQEQNGTTAGAGSRVYTCWRLCAPRNYNMVPYCVSWVVRWKKKGEKCHI